MSKRCPFVVLTECFEDKCAVWRVGRDGVGYCGAGGIPSFGPVTGQEPIGGDPAAMDLEKQTTNGAQIARQTRRSRS